MEKGHPSKFNACGRMFPMRALPFSRQVVYSGEDHAQGGSGKKRRGIMAVRTLSLPARPRWRRADVWRGWLHVLAGSGTGADGSGVSATPGAAQASERAAFEALFRAHERAIFGYLWRMTGDEQSAYDLSQETFLRAWQHFARIRGYEKPEAWLFRVATNLAINYARSRRSPIASATSLPEDGPARSDPAWRIGERENVRAILEGLPARQRAAIILREVYGLSGEELATALGISLAAAKMLLSRGRETFRVAYEREEARGGQI